MGAEWATGFGEKRRETCLGNSKCNEVYEIRENMISINTNSRYNSMTTAQ